jgi:hypothetical protein
MQTFLPYESFSESGKCLDYKRLGKQRVEAYQILRALTGESKGWINHPATKMWKGYEWQLYLYGLAVCQEWRNRGYKDTVRDKLFYMMAGERHRAYPNRIPSWLGGPIHASHRAALLAKNFDYYKQFNWIEEPKIEYIWPSKNLYTI